MNGIGEAAGVPASTVSRLMKGRTSGGTVTAVAKALRISESDILSEIGAGGDLGPWSPPMEAHALGQRERDALNLIIRSMGGQHEARHAEAQKTPQADLTADDYTLAAREHGTGYSARKKREQQEWGDITGPQ